RTTILPSPTHGSANNSSGTTVVLPAPGGATSTAAVCSASAALSAGKASWIGSIGRPLARPPAPGHPSLRGRRLTARPQPRHGPPNARRGGGTATRRFHVES